jgi:hypothetical protein
MFLQLFGELVHGHPAIYIPVEEYSQSETCSTATTTEEADGRIVRKSGE